MELVGCAGGLLLQAAIQIRTTSTVTRGAGCDRSSGGRRRRTCDMPRRTRLVTNQPFATRSTILTDIWTSLPLPWQLSHLNARRATARNLPHRKPIPLSESDSPLLASFRPPNRSCPLSQDIPQPLGALLRSTPGRRSPLRSASLRPRHRSAHDALP